MRLRSAARLVKRLSYVKPDRFRGAVDPASGIPGREGEEAGGACGRCRARVGSGWGCSPPMRRSAVTWPRWTGPRRRSGRPGPGRRACRRRCGILLSSRFSDVDGLGAGADVLLQRRLPARHPGREVPVGARAGPPARCGRRSGTTSARASTRVLVTGEATWDEALLLFLERSGYPEETYHTFSYSPLRDDDGARGRHALRGQRGHRAGHRRAADGDAARLGSDPSVVRTEQESLEFAAAAARPATCADLPFTLTYLFDDDGDRPAGGEQRHRRRAPGRAGRDRGRRSGPGVARRGAAAGRVGAGRARRRPVRRPADRGVERAARPGTGGAAGPAGRRPVRVPGGRPEPVPAARRGLPRVRRASSPATSRRGSRSARSYRDRAAPRGGAGRARPRQDHVLLQHQPRVPHAADADARTAWRSCAPAGRRWPRRCARSWRSSTATGCAWASWSTRCSTSPASRPAACRRATSRPTSRRSPPSWPASSAPPSTGPAWPSRSTARRWPSRSTSTAACGRRWCSTCCPTR